MTRESVRSEMQEGGCRKPRCRTCSILWCAPNAAVSIVAKAGVVSDASPAKTVGGFSLWEIDPSLFLISPGLHDRGHYGRRTFRLDRSRLRVRKHKGKRQGAPDWSTLSGRPRHQPYRQGRVGVCPSNGVVRTARAARRVCYFRSPRHDSSG